MTRHVRDAAYWGMPVGTPIVKGMRPASVASRMARGATKPTALSSPGEGARSGMAAALFARGAGKGRLHAALLRPVPAGPPGVPKAPRARGTRPPATRAGAEAAIREAHAQLSRAPGDWVPLAELRDRLPSHLSRGEVDAALESLALRPGVHLIPWDNRKALTARDRAAALRFGGDDNHALRIEDAAPHTPSGSPAAPKPGTVRARMTRTAGTTSGIEAAKAELQQMQERIRTAGREHGIREDDVAAMLAKMTSPQLTEVARLLGHPGLRRGRKADRAQELARFTVGRLLDSYGIERTGR